MNPKLFLLAIFVLVFSTINVDANSRFKKQTGSNEHGRSCQTQPPVSAPIEGGMLVLLLGGGIAFFSIKKKKAIKI